MRVGLSERSFFVNAALMSIFHGALSCEWLLNPFSPGLGVYNFQERCLVYVIVLMFSIILDTETLEVRVGFRTYILDYLL